MSQDQNQPPPDVTSTTTAPAAQSAAPAITPEIQAMIEAARVEGRNSGAAETRRALEGKIKGQGPNATQHQQSAPQPSAPPAVAVDHMALRAFDRSLGKFDLTDDAMAVVEEDFARANPPDPVAWVTARASAYGWRPRGATTATTTTTPATAPATTPAPMPGSTPPATPVVTNDTPIMSLYRADPSQVARLQADLGAKKFVERLQAEWRATGLRVKR
jgi:hypothetical protein